MHADPLREKIIAARRDLDAFVNELLTRDGRSRNDAVAKAKASAATDAIYVPELVSRLAELDP